MLENDVTGIIACRTKHFHISVSFDSVLTVRKAYNSFIPLTLFEAQIVCCHTYSPKLLGDALL